MENRPPPPPGLPSPPAGAPSSPVGPVPPGGWHQPIPARPVPGQLAGWWSRAGASLVDAIVISIPALLLLLGIAVLVGGPAGGIEISDHETGVLLGVLVVILSILLVLVAVFLAALLYAPLTMRREGRRNGQTWGKQLFGIRVIRMNGAPHTFGSAAVREAVVKLLLFGVVGGTLAYVPTILDWLWPLWDDENRALHDMVVDTRVIRA